ncbi:uncharacterized protein EI90DRAFT_3179517 [Cantharellus anzutake]|uniref:uncharacterized protein n=1 Tax=Cantharellus anzutake TaxID=1750568 RepID=UPI0019032449|nr:uncharacterized protein EI90DRAFT_3179517 [Cantharellus anzutake]KAF8313918.1 hypothetical protein EI90DRAFT_3179517 [Cantharellus anzutake]
MSRTQEQYCAHTEYFHRIPDILRIQMSALIVAYQISRAPPRTSTQGTEHSRQVKRGAGVEIGYWMVPDGCGPHNGQGWAEWQILYLGVLNGAGEGETPLRQEITRMSSPLQNASSSTFDTSILTLQADLSSGLTLLTTAPTANEFLRATEGPFAELKELVMQHTSIANRPRFQPLAPPEKILKEIVQKIWGHSSVQTVDDIGEILENGHVTDDLSLEAGIDSQEAARLRKSHQEAVEKHYPDCAAEANAFYEKVLIHCGDIVLSKDERDAKPNEGLYLLQKVTGKYAAQLAALSTIHPIGVAVVGFIADDTLSPRDSTIAFTSSPMIAEMVKAMGLPLAEDAALAMRNFYDGIKAFRGMSDFSSQSAQAEIAAETSFIILEHLTTPTSEVFGASGLMKSIVMQAKQSVHFSDDLDRYLGNTTVKSEVECDAEDVDYHTPLLKMKEGLSTIDRAYGAHTVRRTDCAGKLKAMIQEATGIMDLGHNWRGVNILLFLLEHRLRFAGWHRSVRRLNRGLPCDWTPRETARCMLQFDHEDPVQTLRVEHMTDDEYLKREVLHYAPDGNGNISKYALPQNEVRRAVGKTAIILASSHKRKGSTPDPTTVSME